MKKSQLLVILFILFGLLNQTTAQNTSLKTWVGVSYQQKVKIKKFKFKIGASQEFRISNIAYIPKYSTFTEVGASTKITKFYKLGLAYRLNYIGGLRHRASLSNSFKIDLKPVTITFRIKYQAEFENDNPFSQDFREKTTIKYAANKDFRPYAFGEILFNNTYNYSNFNEFRLGLGLDADYKKDHQFDIGIMYVQDINQENPGRRIVLSLAYGLSR